MRLERIDLYQLHAPDPHVPFEDSVGALAELRAAGKIRHVGLSNVSVDQLRRARRIVPIVSVQNRYNLDDRGSDDVLAACENDGIAFLAWYPLASGRTRRARPLSRGSRDARRDAGPGRDRVAAGPLAGDRADPWHVVDGTP